MHLQTEGTSNLKLGDVKQYQHLVIAFLLQDITDSITSNRIETI